VIQNLRGTFTSDISNSSYTWDEMSQATPVRIVLPYREQPFQKPTAIINAFFTWRGIQPLREDYYTHICSDPRSSRLYLVLDLHCKTHPNVDLSNLDLEVFKVSGIDPLCVTLFYNLTKLTVFSTFQDLGEVARKQVRQRSASLEWGEGTHSSQRN
jgi:hypothetical protein